MKDAWTKANEIFQTDYIKDEGASAAAGYDIFRSTLKDCNAWISDLGDRLEINFENGETVNIWIEEEAEQPETVAASAEKHISVDIKIDTDNGSRRTTTTDETAIYINSKTKISHIGAFIANVERMLKQAKKSTKNGSRATVTLYTNDGKHINLWMARPDDINDDGIYFSPSSKNEHPEHDFIITSLSASGIMRELAI